MKYLLKYKLLLLVSSSILLSSYNQIGNAWQTMKNAENEFNKRQSVELVAFMSLENMFIDLQVRELAKAASEGDVRKIDDLVNKGVDVNALGVSNATPLYWSMKNIVGFKKLLSLNADPNVIFDDGGSVMHWAAKNENPSYLNNALMNGGDPNLAAGQFKQSPIFETISIFGEIGNSYKLELLLNAGADINFKTSKGDTPVLVAASLGRFDIVYELLKQGADFKSRNSNGRDLAYYLRIKRKALDKKHELFMWLEKVTDWLDMNKTR